MQSKEWKSLCFDTFCAIPGSRVQSIYFITARKRSLRRLCFYRCVSVHRGGACVLPGGACVLPGGVWLQGGMCGWGCAWLWGACMVAGGVSGCREACMVVGGGACMVARGACVGYDEIRSISGRYASYWNAFLSCQILVQKFSFMYTGSCLQWAT